MKLEMLQPKRKQDDMEWVEAFLRCVNRPDSTPKKLQPNDIKRLSKAAVGELRNRVAGKTHQTIFPQFLDQIINTATDEITLKPKKDN